MDLELATKIISLTAAVLMLLGTCANASWSAIGKMLIVFILVMPGILFWVYGMEAASSSPPMTGQTFRDCPNCPEMVWLPAGSFRMGSEDSEERHSRNEYPVRTVAFSQPFAMGKTPVTQAQWKAVMGDNPSYFSDCDQCPVERVSWDEAQEYIRRLNQQTEQRYRLPSEAEWEYACRAGQQHRYCGSDNVDAVAWYSANSDGHTHPVAVKQPNDWGLYDMSGNVWEWTQDCWNESYRGAPSDGRAWTQGSCDRRMVRGGSWSNDPYWSRSAYRGRTPPAFRYERLGLRVARSPSSSRPWLKKLIDIEFLHEIFVRS